MPDYANLGVDKSSVTIIMNNFASSRLQATGSL